MLLTAEPDDGLVAHATPADADEALWQERLCGWMSHCLGQLREREPGLTLFTWPTLRGRLVQLLTKELGVAQLDDALAKRIRPSLYSPEFWAAHGVTCIVRPGGRHVLALTPEAAVRARAMPIPEKKPRHRSKKAAEAAPAAPAGTPHRLQTEMETMPRFMAIYGLERAGTQVAFKSLRDRFLDYLRNGDGVPRLSEQQYKRAKKEFETDFGTPAYWQERFGVALMDGTRATEGSKGRYFVLPEVAAPPPPQRKRKRVSAASTESEAQEAGSASPRRKRLRLVVVQPDASVTATPLQRAHGHRIQAGNCEVLYLPEADTFAVRVLEGQATLHAQVIPTGGAPVPLTTQDLLYTDKDAVLRLEETSAVY